MQMRQEHWVSTPVLITPVSRQYTNDNSYAGYQETVISLVEDENVLLLDFRLKSYTVFHSYESHTAVQEAFG